MPLDAKEIAFLRLTGTAGRDFAALTGDVNPIHWFAPAARAAGFRGCILHGFRTLARTIEALNRRVFAGDPRALASIDVRFMRPLVLPAKRRGLRRARRVTYSSATRPAAARISKVGTRRSARERVKPKSGGLAS